MTHHHSDADTPADRGQQATEEPASDDELIPSAASDWNPEVDDYRISTA